MSDSRRWHILVEDLFIILSILALWPAILGWKSPVYEVLRYLALAGLIAIFIRRVRRYRQRRDRG